MSEPSLDDLVQRVTAILEAEGLRASLGFLNGRIRHRFTGVYRFDPPMLRSVCLFDRENPALCVASEAPMRETYCSLVGESGTPVAIRDAEHDRRVAGHPARSSVLAYCGVPLFSGDGTAFGSLCHFDLRPRLAPLAEAELLSRVAPLIARVVEAAARSAPPPATAGVEPSARRGFAGR